MNETTQSLIEAKKQLRKEAAIQRARLAAPFAKLADETLKVIKEQPVKKSRPKKPKNMKPNADWFKDPQEMMIYEYDHNGNPKRSNETVKELLARLSKNRLIKAKRRKLTTDAGGKVRFEAGRRALSEKDRAEINKDKARVQKLRDSFDVKKQANLAKLNEQIAAAKDKLKRKTTSARIERLKQKRDSMEASKSTAAGRLRYRIVLGHGSSAYTQDPYQYRLLRKPSTPGEPPFTRKNPNPKLSYFLIKAWKKKRNTDLSYTINLAPNNMPYGDLGFLQALENGGGTLRSAYSPGYAVRYFQQRDYTSVTFRRLPRRKFDRTTAAKRPFVSKALEIIKSRRAEQFKKLLLDSKSN